MENTMPEGKVARAPNFTCQECHLLAEIMGEEHPDFEGLSRHKLDKHKFTEKITSAKKKAMWREIESIFNKNALHTYRRASDLQKKWENLVSKHRCIYSDYVRERNATGSGPSSSNSKYTILTEAIISVIGKDCIAVKGIAGFGFDSTMNQLNQNSDIAVVDVTENDEKASGTPKRLIGQKTSNSLVESNKIKRCAECHCDEELLKLKKKKLKLQIAYFEKQLGLTSEQ